MSKTSDHMAKIFASNNIDTVYHAAAYKHVPLVQEKHNISKSWKITLLVPSISH